MMDFRITDETISMWLERHDKGMFHSEPRICWRDLMLDVRDAKGEIVRLRDALCVSDNARLEYAQRCDRLQALVDKLAKTADGVPVEIGDEVFFPGSRGPLLLAWDLIPRTGGVYGYVGQDGESGFAVSLIDCYSTCAAAEAAKAVEIDDD